MQTITTLAMPSIFVPVADEELVYLDGGAETGIWRNWDFSSFLHGFTLALGSASITAGTNFILTSITAGATLGGALSAAGAAVAAFSGVQYALLGVCVATAAYTIYYEFMTVYLTLESLWYRIFPKKEPQEESAEAVVTNGLHLAIV